MELSSKLKDRRMDNVQNCDSYVDIWSSQPIDLSSLLN
jgi:hypothetical protein